jgi:hypothetical protein
MNRRLRWQHLALKPMRSTAALYPYVALYIRALSRQTDFQTPVVQFSINIPLQTSMTGDVAGEG